MGLSLTFWQVVVSRGRRSLLGALVIDGLPDHWPSAKALIATVYTGAIPMALGTATWFALVKLLPAQVAALSSIAIPIVAVVSGVLLLDEPLSIAAGRRHRLDRRVAVARPGAAEGSAEAQPSSKLVTPNRPA